MFLVGDKVMYPMHGAGVIEAIEEKEILGNKQYYYVVTIGNMQVMFPQGSKVAIRPVVDANMVEDVLMTTFQEEDSIASLSPSQRYRTNMNKMKSGDIYEGAQVIRDLARMGSKRSLTTSDKSMFDNARQIFISELALVKGIDEDEASGLLEEALQSLT
ncbi:CarD family transcriptional regulator [Heliorestis acidaminivorans]|uniref:CarD family transcriptional regulator n=1 Tax=Heliorestis acidaminivorans TaxID=553427 RepID=A0A6I0F1N7_9FIRM|nr:CarD family transcriptional regulator [Heliorestis acidaminivorans]KAB2953841.1 CarD family transcriptional regulator [Heliorestis acidaminivorans]